LFRERVGYRCDRIPEEDEHKPERYLPFRRIPCEFVLCVEHVLLTLASAFYAEIEEPHWSLLERLPFPIEAIHSTKEMRRKIFQ